MPVVINLAVVRSGKMFGPGYRHNNMKRNHHMHGFGLRYWILAIAMDNDVTGVDIASKISEKTDGRWVPSPGIIYPALSSMYSGEYLTMEERNNKKYYRTTEKGKEFLDNSYFPWKEILGMREYSNVDDAIDKIEGYIQYLIDNYENLNDRQKDKIKSTVNRLNNLN